MAQLITYAIENRLYLSITDQCTLSCTFCVKNNDMLRFLADATRHVHSVTATAIDGLRGVDIPACRRLAGELGVRFRRRVLGKV